MKTNTPESVDHVSPSAPYHFLYGKFALGKYTVPYLVLSMRLNDAARELHIAEEAGPLGLEDADLQELYQRQVDWGRVLHSIVPYLKDARRPQFFNALTVTMLPYNKGAFTTFDDPNLKAPRLSGEFSLTHRLGPISLGGWDCDSPDGLQIGKIQWNLDQLRCIAIDGQHRLGALQQLNDEQDARLQDSYITVLAVIPDAYLGFRSESNSTAQIRLMRRLFTDLNQHAVPVSRTRQLLLDDYDPQSLCVREALGEKLTSFDTDWHSKDPFRIPLGLVDWHTDDSKFHDGPYCTTILVLDQIIGEITDLRPVRDWTDSDLIERVQLKPLEALGWEPSDACRRRIKELGEQENPPPFSFPAEDLNAARLAFRSTWGAAIATVFGTLEPYRRLTNLRVKHRMNIPDFVLWFDAFDRVRRHDNEKTLRLLAKVKNHLSNLDPPVSPARTWQPWVESKKGEGSKMSREKQDQLAFKVVFQKAIFFALKRVSAYGSGYTPDDSDLQDVDHVVLDASSPTGFSNYLWSRQLCECLNELQDVSRRKGAPALMSVGHRTARASNLFWLGTIADADGNIDFTNAAAKRASIWLALAVLLWRHAPENYSKIVRKLRKPESFMEAWSEALQALQDESGAVGVLGEALFGNRQGRAMRKLVQAMNPDWATDSQEFADECNLQFAERFSYLVDLIQKCDAG